MMELDEQDVPQPQPRPHTPPSPSESSRQLLKRPRLTAHQSVEDVDESRQQESLRLPLPVNRTLQLGPEVLDRYTGLAEYQRISDVYAEKHIRKGWELLRRSELCQLFRRFSQADIEFVRQFSWEDIDAGLSFRELLPLYDKIHEEELSKCMSQYISTRPALILKIFV
jgi:hypothetical protein